MNFTILLYIAQKPDLNANVRAFNPNEESPNYNWHFIAHKIADLNSS